MKIKNIILLLINLLIINSKAMLRNEPNTHLNEGNNPLNISGVTGAEPNESGSSSNTGSSFTNVSFPSGSSSSSSSSSRADRKPNESDSGTGSSGGSGAGGKQKEEGDIGIGSNNVTTHGSSSNGSLEVNNENSTNISKNTSSSNRDGSEKKLGELERIICQEISRLNSKKPSEQNVSSENSNLNDQKKESENTASIDQASFKEGSFEEDIKAMSFDSFKNAVEKIEVNNLDLDDKAIVLFLKKYGCKKAKIVVDKHKEKNANQGGEKTKSFEKIIKIYEIKSVILKTSTLIFIVSAIYLTDNLLSVHFKHNFRDKMIKFVIPSLVLLFSGIMIYCSYINVDVLHNTISKYIN